MRLFSLALLCGLIWPGEAAFARKFTVLATPQAPFKYEEAGRLKGIDIDVLKQVMAEMGIDYTVRLIRSDPRIQAEARAGRADMLLLFSRKPDRMDYLDYPAQSYIDLTWHFFVRREDRDRIRFQSFEDLRGLRVGATKDVSYTPEFWRAGLDLQIVSNNDLQVRKLLAGRIDVVALNTINTLYDARLNDDFDQLAFLPKPLTSKPYYNVFPKASTHPKAGRLRQEYDRIISRLKRQGVIERIVARYLGEDYARGLKQAF